MKLIYFGKRIATNDANYKILCRICKKYKLKKEFKGGRTYVCKECREALGKSNLSITEKCSFSLSQRPTNCRKEEE